MKRIYVCNDSVQGVFSAIYDAWKSGGDEEECGITIRGQIEQQLFCDYVEVEETEHKAIVVEQLIRKHLGEEAYGDIYHAALAPDIDKGDAILGTMFAARRLADSRRIMEYLSNKHVERVFELNRKVTNESHLTKEFIRFRELENGILYAAITPKSQVLTCVAPHFADRFPLENWMIHDKTHQMFVIHEAKKRWALVWDELTNAEALLRVSEDEKKYAKLWKEFHDTIAIESRKNPRCQRGHLPLRYRGNMTEFQL